MAGSRTATHLARIGRMSGRDRQALLRADAIFRTEYAPYCPNGF
jgi:hypothetical protein